MNENGVVCTCSVVDVCNLIYVCVLLSAIFHMVSEGVTVLDVVCFSQINICNTNVAMFLFGFPQH